MQHGLRSIRLCAVHWPGDHHRWLGGRYPVLADVRRPVACHGLPRPRRSAIPTKIVHEMEIPLGIYNKHVSCVTTVVVCVDIGAALVVVAMATTTAVMATPVMTSPIR